MAGVAMGQFSASAGITLTTLVTFDGTNGAVGSGLVQTPDGSFYGTTLFGGGVGGSGSVFRLDPDGTFSTIFSSTPANGALPHSIIQARDGNLYGMTGDWIKQGNEWSFGTVWKLSTNGVFTNLVSFRGTNGIGPTGLYEARDGCLLGVTDYGGPGQSQTPFGALGLGTIFSLNTNGDFVNLAYFDGTNGCYPISIGEVGNGELVGCTTFGGIGFNGDDNSGFGTVYLLATNGSLGSLLQFDGSRGIQPIYSTGVVINEGYSMVGTLHYGGVGGSGGVFEFFIESGGAAYTPFAPPQGRYPTALIRASDNSIYGLTTGGGANNSGTVFRYTSEGIETIYSFDGINGAFPEYAIIQGADNNFDGTTSEGGTFNRGTIFRLSIPLQPMLQIDLSSTNTVVLSWDAVVGQTYQFQSSTNLVDWQDFGLPIPATNAKMNIVEPLSTAISFNYRLCVLP